MITSRQYRQRVGRKPERDDLERCNCRRAGSIHHQQCGLNRWGMPYFMPGIPPRQRIRVLRAKSHANARPSPRTRKRWTIAFRVSRSQAMPDERFSTRYGYSR